MEQEKWVPKIECIIPRTKGALEDALDIYLSIVTTEETWAREALRHMKYVASPEKIKIQTDKLGQLQVQKAFLSELMDEVAGLSECEEEEEPFGD